MKRILTTIDTATSAIDAITEINMARRRVLSVPENQVDEEAWRRLYNARDHIKESLTEEENYALFLFLEQHQENQYVSRHKS